MNTSPSFLDGLLSGHGGPDPTKLALDGSNSMLANLQLGLHKAVNMANGTAPTDGVNVYQLGLVSQTIPSRFAGDVVLSGGTAFYPIPGIVPGTLVRTGYAAYSGTTGYVWGVAVDGGVRVYSTAGADDTSRVWFEVVDGSGFYSTNRRVVELRASGSNDWVNLNSIGEQLSLIGGGEIYLPDPLYRADTVGTLYSNVAVRGAARYATKVLSSLPYVDGHQSHVFGNNTFSNQFGALTRRHVVGESVLHVTTTEGIIEGETWVASLNQTDADPGGIEVGLFALVTDKTSNTITIDRPLRYTFQNGAKLYAGTPVFGASVKSMTIKGTGDRLIWTPGFINLTLDDLKVVFSGVPSGGVNMPHMGISMDFGGRGAVLGDIEVEFENVTDSGPCGGVAFEYQDGPVFRSIRVFGSRGAGGVSLNSCTNGHGEFVSVEGGGLTDPITTGLFTSAPVDEYESGGTKSFEISHVVVRDCYYASSADNGSDVHVQRLDVFNCRFGHNVARGANNARVASMHIESDPVAAFPAIAFNAESTAGSNNTCGIITGVCNVVCQNDSDHPISVDNGFRGECRKLTNHVSPGLGGKIHMGPCDLSGQVDDGAHTGALCYSDVEGSDTTIDELNGSISFGYAGYVAFLSNNNSKLRIGGGKLTSHNAVGYAGNADCLAIFSGDNCSVEAENFEYVREDGGGAFVKVPYATNSEVYLRNTKDSGGSASVDIQGATNDLYEGERVTFGGSVSVAGTHTKVTAAAV